MRTTPLTYVKRVNQTHTKRDQSHSCELIHAIQLANNRPHTELLAKCWQGKLNKFPHTF